MDDVKLMLQDVNRAIAESDFSLSQPEVTLLEMVEFSLAQGWDLTEEQDEKFEALWKKVVGHDE